MNSRRVHALMRKHFPPVEHAIREWVVVQSEKGTDHSVISELLAKHIHSSEVLIEVHRKCGNLLPIEDVSSFIDSHIGEGEIHVTDRHFSGFVVVALNGVATGWSHSG